MLMISVQYELITSTDKGVFNKIITLGIFN
jgi:hypothetical protein